MPYRHAPLPEPDVAGLDTAFWQQKNTVSGEGSAIRSADTQIVNGLTRFVQDWYKETQRRYPTTYHVILHDLNQAANGRGTYLKVRGKSRYLLGVLTSIAELGGWLSVNPELFDQAKATHAEVSASVKESAIRWSQQDPQIRRVLSAAFRSNSAKLDQDLLYGYPVPPEDLMEGVYFRSVAQYDFLFFESPRTAQNLFLYLYG